MSLGIQLPLRASGVNIWAEASSGSRIVLNVLTTIIRTAIFLSSIFDTLIHFLFLNLKFSLF